MANLRGVRCSLPCLVVGVPGLSAEKMREIAAIESVITGEQLFGAATAAVPADHQQNMWLGEGTEAYPAVPVPLQRVVGIQMDRGDTGHEWQGLLEALREQNSVFWTTGPGARYKWHRCTKCQKAIIVNGLTKYIRALCLDGITLGNRCCSIEGCGEPMPVGWHHRFCLLHEDQQHVCAINVCKAAVDAAAGHRTCEEHRRVQEAYDRQKDKGGYMARLPPGSEAEKQVLAHS